MPDKLTPHTVAEAHEVTPEDVFDQEAFLRELAALSPIAYDQFREEGAKTLGIRVSTLDAEIAIRRPKRNDNLGHNIILLDSPEPCAETVDGATLLDDLAAIFNRYLVLPRGGVELLALWVLFTYAHNASMISPILGIISPEKRCGKTTLLTLLRRLVAKPLPGANITPAVVYRAVEMYQPTLLIDEADTFLKDNDELRGVINSGHTRDTAFVLRADGENNEPRQFSTWAPKAIALIGKLPGTLADRAIILPMQRKKRYEKVEKLRLDRLDMFQAFPSRCARWVEDHANALIQSDPAMPEGLHDRAEDNWRPLVAIAELCGWQGKTLQAIAHLEQPDDDTESVGVLLIGDMRQLFAKQKTDRLLSKNLAKELADMEERPWPEWKNGKPITVNQIARLLSRYGIRPKTIKTGIAKQTAKGYKLEECQETFESYLSPPDPPFLSVTPSPTSNHADLNDFQTVTTDEQVTDAKSQEPTPNKDGYAVTDQYMEEPEETVFEELF